MATKIGGDQLRLEDFIKNPTPNGDWSSTLFTASLAAIKALMSASGIPELSGTVNLWEKEGLYIVKGDAILNTGGGSFRTNTDSILLITSIYSSYNYKNYICINGMGNVETGTTHRNGGTIYYSSLREFVGAGESYRGSSGIVPEPQAGDQGKFLKGNGSWGESQKLLKITFVNVYDREHHIDYWAPKKTETTYYTINELKQLMNEGYMIIAIAGTSSTAGNYYYPDERWNGQTSNQLLFRKTGVENGTFTSKLLELNSSDYPGYGEIWKINTEFSINV